MEPLLTGSALVKICPSLTQKRADAIADQFSFLAPGYGIKTKDLIRELIANVAHESGEFKIMEENMNYITPQRIVDVWPSRFVVGKDPAGKKKDATQYIRNPKKLANEVYNGRMGNRTGTDDGYNFRGSGYLQLTGRETAQLYAKFHSDMDVVDLMQKVRTEDFWSVDSACWEYAISLKLLKLAEGDEYEDFVKIVKRINGGTIGLAERARYFEKCVLYI